jgi:hypothetical protein
VELTSAMLHCDCSTKPGKTFRPEAFTVGGTRLAVDHESWARHNYERQLGVGPTMEHALEKFRYQGGTKPEQPRPSPIWTKAKRPKAQ